MVGALMRGLRVIACALLCTLAVAACKSAEVAPAPAAPVVEKGQRDGTAIKPRDATVAPPREAAANAAATNSGKGSGNGNGNLNGNGNGRADRHQREQMVILFLKCLGI